MSTTTMGKRGMTRTSGRIAEKTKKTGNLTTTMKVARRSPTTRVRGAGGRKNEARTAHGLGPRPQDDSDRRSTTAQAGMEFKTAQRLITRSVKGAELLRVEPATRAVAAADKKMKKNSGRYTLSQAKEFKYSLKDLNAVIPEKAATGFWAAAHWDTMGKDFRTQWYETYSPQPSTAPSPSQASSTRPPLP